MSFLLIPIGIVLLLICLTGMALGIYMASDIRTREPGVFFALCWVSGAAASAGVVMRDGVTFLVGLLCFLVAGAAFILFGDTKSGPTKRDRVRTPDEIPEGSEKTTKENRASYRRVVS